MRAVFVDANPTLAEVMERLHRADDMQVAVNRNPDIKPEGLPAAMGHAEIAIIDHTHLPLDIAKQCKALKHVVFLGTGARSYMNPNELKEELGVEVHIIKGYGYTAVAEMAFSLMWAAAKGLGVMDRGIARGQWPRTDGVQLLGDRDRRLHHLVCLGIDGIEPQPVLLGLDRVGVSVHSGSSCSSEALEPSPVLEAMGVDADRSLRVSVGWDTTDADVDRLLDALPEVLHGLRALGGRA